MKRDWIWAWVSGLPAMIIALIVAGSSGLLATSPWVAFSLIFAFAAGTATLILWWQNQRSLRKIERSGGEIELIIRPIDALGRILILFPTLFGAYVLMNLLIHGPAIEWGQMIAWSACMAYVLGLAQTAYKKPKS
jgi:hypothetical protein